MENNLKKTQNYPTNQGSIFAKDLISATKRLSFLNLFLLKLGFINLLILTYFFWKKDISFRATGWFPIPENIHWYYIFLVLILVRMLIVYITHKLTEYIKNLSLWNEKEKKNALNALAVINILTLPINLPLIGGLYTYLKGGEIISNNWFLGTFRRIITENERIESYQTNIQNFLEKMEASKEIKDQLKNWARENNKTILEKYDNGSAFATEYLSEQLEIQKNFLELEEIKNYNLDQSVQTGFTDKDQQGLFPWIFEKTINGLNYWNPFVTDYKTCAIAWILLVGTGVILLVITKSNLISLNEIKCMNEDIKTNAESIIKQANFMQQSTKIIKNGFKSQNLKIDVNKMTTDQVLIETINKINYQQTILQNLSETAILNTKVNALMTAQIKAIIENPRSLIGVPHLENIVIQEKKKQILTNMLKKYESQSLSMTTFQEMMKELLKEMLK